MFASSKTLAIIAIAFLFSKSIFAQTGFKVFAGPSFSNYTVSNDSPISVTSTLSNTTEFNFAVSYIADKNTSVSPGIELLFKTTKQKMLLYGGGHMFNSKLDATYWLNTVSPSVFLSITPGENKNFSVLIGAFVKFVFYATAKGSFNSWEYGVYNNLPSINQTEKILDGNATRNFR